jgi:hypothetical protein
VICAEGSSGTWNTVVHPVWGSDAEFTERLRGGSQRSVALWLGTRSICEQISGTVDKFRGQAGFLFVEETSRCLADH